MKKLAVILALTLLFAASPHSLAAKNDKSKETAEQKERYEDIALEGVTKISVAHAINVEIVDRDSNQIKIKGNSYHINNLRVKVANNELKIYLSDIHSFKKPVSLNRTAIEIEVPYNGLLSDFKADSFSMISSSVDIITENLTIEADAASVISLTAVVAQDCKVSVDAASKVNLIALIKRSCIADIEAASSAYFTIDAASLVVDTDAASKVTAQGSVQKLDVSAEAASSFDGSNLTFHEAKLKAEGMSRITHSGSSKNLKESRSSMSTINIK